MASGSIGTAWIGRRAAAAVVLGFLVLGLLAVPVQAEAATPAAGPDLDITLERLTDPAVAGEPVEFLVTVDNVGDAPVTGIDVVQSADPLFADMIGVPSQGSCGPVDGTFDMHCPIGTLGVGQSAVVTLVTHPANVGNAYLTSVAYSNEATPAISDTLWTTIDPAAPGVVCDRWASVSGDDTAVGTYDAPRRTLRGLVGLLAPGETGCVKAGETLDLSGGWGIVNAGGGTEGNPVTVRSEPGGPRAGMQGLIHIQSHIHDVVLTDLHIAGPTAGAVKNVQMLIDGDRITIADNEVTYPRGICMQIGNVNTDARADDLLVRGNRIHDCGTSPDLTWTVADSGAHGMYVQHALDAVITDNYIYDNQFRGIQTWPGPEGTTIKNNVLDGNGSNVNMGHDLPAHVSEDTKVFDNIITNATLFFDLSKNPANVHGTIPTDTYGNAVTDNCVHHPDPSKNFSGTGYTAADNLIVDPQYVDRAGKDFSLAPDSPCEGKGPQSEPAPAAGQLRVTTSPALPATISVDGIERDAWGLNWLEIDAGEHEVCFAHVPGFDAPACEEVDVVAGQTTTVEGQYAPRGTLRVTTNPALPSTITVDGIPRNDWGVWTDVEPGPHEVCFGAVADFATPACQEVVVTPGATTEVSGTFVFDAGAPGPAPGYGHLRVETDPAVASRILVDGEWADSWGLTWLQLAPGEYEVCFEGVVGTRPPDCETAVVTGGATTEITGAVELQGFLRVVTSPAVGATITVDGVAANAWGVWVAKDPGTYEVCFGPAPGYTTPPCQDAAISASATTTITGTYTPV